MNSKKNILISIEKFPPDFTGAGLRALKTAKRMHKKFGFNFLVLTFNNSNKFENKDSFIEIKRINIKISKIIFPLYLIELFIKVNIFLYQNKNRINLIHFFSFYWLNRIVMLINYFLYKKHTILEITMDGDDDPMRLLSKNFINKTFSGFTKLLLLKIDKYVVQTNYCLNSCTQVGININKIWKRPNPIDENLFGTINFNKKEELKNKLKISKKFTMINIGSIIPRKNQLLLLKCLKYLNNKNIQLLLIGPKLEERNYFKQIMKYINENNLNEQVIIIGEKNNIHEYLIASDLFVFSSFREGFGNVFAEAMISGLPIISLYLDGISNYINIKNGVLIENKNEKEKIKKFASTILKIYNKKTLFNNETIRKMGINYFSSQKIDLKYKKLFDDLIKN
jgi:glycosyltransferase involved in cell wall biosynthesis